MFHTIIIVGNLGAEPEMRYIANGQAVTRFNVASTHQYRNAEGQNIKETTWFRISVWGKQAETANNYLHKGNKVLIEGRLKPDPATGNPRIWNRQDGSPAASFEVTASLVRFLTPKGEGASGEEISDAGEADSGEEIPF